MFKKLAITSAILISSTFAITTESHAKADPTAIHTVTGDTEAKLVALNDFRYRKKKVKYSTEYSKFKPVSDAITTTKATGSISSSKSVTFGTSVSGIIKGLNISTNVSRSSTVGYTLNVKPNATGYMGYRVKYKVEKGVRELYDTLTGKVKSKNSYTVKKPIMGEYKIIYTKK